MATDGPWTRQLEWEGCLNVRDLGGYPAADGRETRWGAVVRSDNLSPLTDAGREALRDHGIKSIIDLRMQEELEQLPNPFAGPGDHGIAYTNVSFINPNVPPPEEFTTLAHDYAGMLDRFQPEVSEIMRTIARAPEGGVLVHCHAGKDRTGLVCALLLELAGVDRKTISAEYALSEEYLRPLREESLPDEPGERAEREKELSKYSPRAEVMMEVLERLDQEYGGAEQYLLRAGLAPQDIELLRERMLPQPSASEGRRAEN
jgi:protein-tyrosine phosphatase